MRCVLHTEVNDVLRRRLLTLLGLGLFGPTAAKAQQIQMLDASETIGLEHTTRSQRLRRLVREQRVTPGPEFYEYVVPARLMPEGFRHDTPVLRVVFPESTFFDTAQSQLVETAYPIIRAMADMLEGDVPDVATFVAGHADNRGSEPYNYELSVARARAVAEALRFAGAARADVWSVGFGESLPLYENSTDLNMSYNRRVEFLFAARRAAAANWLKDQMDLACSAGGETARNRCLVALKLRPEYVIEAVEPASVLRQQHQARRALRAEPRTEVIAGPKPKQIIINLAERKVVVARPEL